MKTAYITHPDCLKHEMAETHPECPQRISAIETELKARNLFDRLDHHIAPKAETEQLKRAHEASFVDGIFQITPDQGYHHIDGDTSMNPFTLEAALRSAGAGILATDLVLSDASKRAFCNVRPPGHHAEKDRAMGFCFFSNIAVAAMHAIEKYQIKRLAIVDFDVHHGNGTEDVVAEQDEILFCSTYQHPFYPGYAGPSVKSKRVNVPLSAYSGSAEFREAVESHWLPELVDFKPELIYISAGFDAHADDAMSALNLRDNDYRWATEEICKIANSSANGRVISMLEGGYDLASLGRASAEHVAVLLED